MTIERANLSIRGAMQPAYDAILTEEACAFLVDLVRAFRPGLKTLLATRQQDETTLRKLSNQLVAKYSYTGWTTGGHTAADVAVLAYGKDAKDFAGFQDNTQIAKKLMQYIQQTK